MFTLKVMRKMLVARGANIKVGSEKNPLNPGDGSRVWVYL